MSPRGDDVHEMPRRRPIDDQAVERILRGETAGVDLDGLHAFVSDVRAAAAGPMPAPSPALEHVLTRGLSTDQGDLPATAASNANGPALQAAGLPKWRSATMKMSRYVAGLSIAAKITLGVGCAFAVTAGAAAAGVLPGPVQNAVDAVTPFHGDGTGDTTAPPSTPPGDAASGTGTISGTGTGTGVATGDGPGTGTPPSAGTGTGTGTGTETPGGTPAPGAGTGGEPKHEPTPAPPTEPAPPPVTEAPHPVTPPAGEPTPPPPTEPPVAETMTMHCAINDGHVSIHCEWTLAPPAGFGHYALLRTSDDGKPGRVLSQPDNIATHNWTDSLDLTPGVTYSYMVITIGPDGTTTTGHSNHVALAF